MTVVEPASGTSACGGALAGALQTIGDDPPPIQYRISRRPARTSPSDLVWRRRSHATAPRAVRTARASRVVDRRRHGAQRAPVLRPLTRRLAERQDGLANLHQQRVVLLRPAARHRRGGRWASAFGAAPPGRALAPPADTHLRAAARARWLAKGAVRRPREAVARRHRGEAARYPRLAARAVVGDGAPGPVRQRLAARGQVRAAAPVAEPVRRQPWRARRLEARARGPRGWRGRRAPRQGRRAGRQHGVGWGLAPRGGVGWGGHAYREPRARRACTGRPRRGSQRGCAAGSAGRPR